MNQSPPLIPLTAGERFMQRRLELGFSLGDVSEVIKLDQRVLRDIEGDREIAIAPVYRNGYIRKYAGFLGIPEEEVLELLQGPDSEPRVRSVFSMPAKRNAAEKWLRVTSYVMASLLIGTLAWQFTYEAVRLSQDDPDQRETGLGNTTAKVHADTVAASIAPLGALHGSTAEAGDTAEQAWAAINRLTLADGQSRIKISVSADSWVEIVDATGQELEMDLLRGGSDKDYIGQAPFSILVGRAAAVRLAVDGEELDLAAHTRDDVAQLTWPQSTQEKE